MMKQNTGSVSHFIGGSSIICLGETKFRATTTRKFLNSTNRYFVNLTERYIPKVCLAFVGKEFLQ